MLINICAELYTFVCMGTYACVCVCAHMEVRNQPCVLGLWRESNLAGLLYMCVV